MSVEEIIKDLRNEMESIYSRREHLSEKSFVFCSHCRKRIIDSIIEDEYFTVKNNCQECQTLRQELSGQVVKFFEGLGLTKEELQRSLENKVHRKSFIAILYGVFTKGPSIPLSFPQTCLFELTYRCNLKCKHCYIGTLPATEEMDTQSVLQVIRKVAEAGFGVFELTGGEPLLRDDLSAIVKEIKSYDMNINLSTNGTLFSLDKVKELKPYLDKVTISIDSHEEANHDNFRGVDDALKMALNGIKNCVDNNIPVNIYTTLTIFIHKKLPEFINYMEELKVSSITFFDLNPVGRGSTVGSEFRLSLNELKTAFNTLYKLKNESSVEILALAPFKFVMDQQMLTKNTILSGGFCNAGTNSLSISPEGDMLPCTRVRIKLGNALKDDVREVWINSPILGELRDREKLRGACGKCEYKYVCGGCRANAYGEYNDYLTGDPRCIC